MQRLAVEATLAVTDLVATIHRTVADARTIVGKRVQARSSYSVTRSEPATVELEQARPAFSARRSISFRVGAFSSDKEHRGILIFVRRGVATQQCAKQGLAREIFGLRRLAASIASRRTTFAYCVTRYRTACKGKRLPARRARMVRFAVN